MAAERRATDTMLLSSFAGQALPDVFRLAVDTAPRPRVTKLHNGLADA